MKRILVTGCSGFIGMHLCKNLLDCGESILGIDNMNDYYSKGLKKERLRKIKEYDNFRFSKINLCDLESLKLAFDKFNPEIVVNLAAQAGVRYSLINPNAYIEANIMGFMNILECCRKNNINNLVYASSSSVYGANDTTPFNENDNVNKPISIYATSKRSNELMAYAYNHLYGLNTVGLRYFTVYGPWGRPDMSYYIFCEKINKGEPISIFNNGNMQRDFTYIDDIIEGTTAAIYKNYNCEIFNLGNNRCENVMDIIYLIEDTLGKKAVIDYKAIQLGDVQKTFADIEYSKLKLNYNPKTTIASGIPKFVDWYMSYNNLK